MDPKNDQPAGLNSYPTLDDFPIRPGDMAFPSHTQPVGSYEHHIAQLGELILIVEVLLFGALAIEATASSGRVWDGSRDSLKGDHFWGEETETMIEINQLLFCEGYSVKSWKPSEIPKSLGSPNTSAGSLVASEGPSSQPAVDPAPCTTHHTWH